MELEQAGPLEGGVAQRNQQSDGAFPSELEQGHGRDSGHPGTQQWTLLLGAKCVTAGLRDEVSKSKRGNVAMSEGRIPRCGMFCRRDCMCACAANCYDVREEVGKSIRESIMGILCLLVPFDSLSVRHLLSGFKVFFFICIIYRNTCWQFKIGSYFLTQSL